VTTNTATPNPSAGPDPSDALSGSLLRLGDNGLILGHRLSEWCGKTPALEEDIALANTALDLIGQAQLWLELAGECEGDGRSADDLAYRRDASDFRHALLVEQPNGDYGRTLVRQFLFDAWHLPTLRALAASSDARVAAIADKASREVAYHLERSTDLIVRLGDGTDESHARMQGALDALWPYADELRGADEAERALAADGIAADPDAVAAAWEAHVGEVLRHATLVRPEDGRGRYKGDGRRGRHGEHLGHLLAEMQCLPRAYPDARW